MKEGGEVKITADGLCLEGKVGGKDGVMTGQYAAKRRKNIGYWLFCIPLCRNLRILTISTPIFLDIGLPRVDFMWQMEKKLPISKDIINRFKVISNAVQGLSGIGDAAIVDNLEIMNHYLSIAR